jgi:hypothetical protein
MTGRIVLGRGGSPVARLAARLLGVLVLACALVAVAPVTMTALVGAALAWLRGWPPARLYRAAGWCAPMLAVWLAATALTRGGAAAVIRAPADAWLALWHARSARAYAAAVAVAAPAAVPLGLLAAGLAWSSRLRAMATLAGGTAPGAAIAFDQRQWRHQVRSAAARIAAPGSVPLLTAGGDVVVGAVIRAVNQQAGVLTRFPADRLRSHQVVVGTTGTGKTTLLLRLWAAFMATGLRRHAAGEAGPPLLVVLDCKGGADARRIAERARRLLRDAGARSVAIWPDEASLTLWALPPRQLVSTLVDLIEHGTGGAAYYTDVMEAVVALAVDAPAGPPASSLDFLARLDPGWLTLAYAGGDFDDQLRLVRSAAGQVADIALRFRTLFRRLGPGLDGPGEFANADAWYCILEGTGDLPVAEAQARALIDLLAAHVTTPRGPASEPTAKAAAVQALLAVDEFSAVARRLPIWQLYERARSLGLAVQVSAQSWHGLAPAESDRYRIAAAAEGGIWLLRTAYPEPVTALAGRHKTVDSTRHLLGFPRWSRQGTSRVQETPVADPALIRILDVGQVAYFYRGGVTYTLVKRLVAGPAALTAVPARASPAAVAPAAAVGSAPGGESWPAAAGAAPDRRRLPDVSTFLDAAFGPARAARDRSRRGQDTS